MIDHIIYLLVLILSMVAARAPVWKQPPKQVYRQAPSLYQQNLQQMNRFVENIQRLQGVQARHEMYLKNHQTRRNAINDEYDRRQQELENLNRRISSALKDSTLMHTGDPKHLHMISQKALDISRLNINVIGTGRTSTTTVTYDGIKFKLINSANGYWEDEFGQTRVTIKGTGDRRKFTNFRFTQSGLKLRYELLHN